MAQASHTAEARFEERMLPGQLGSSNTIQASALVALLRVPWSLRMQSLV